MAMKPNAQPSLVKTLFFGPILMVIITEEVGMIPFPSWLFYTLVLAFIGLFHTHLRVLVKRPQTLVTGLTFAALMFPGFALGLWVDENFHELPRAWVRWAGLCVMVGLTIAMVKDPEIETPAWLSLG